MLGDGRTHGSPVSAYACRAVPAAHPHDVDLQRLVGLVREVLRGEEQGQLADGHRRAAGRSRDARRTSRTPGRSTGPRGPRPVVGFGRSSTTKRLPVSGGRDHAVVHRPDVGVEPRAGVLDVEDHRVHAGAAEDVGERVAALQVGVVDRQPGALVDVAALRAAGLRRAAEAVLRAEDGDQVDLVRGRHHVDLVGQVGQDAGRVGDDAHLLTAQHVVAAGDQLLDPGPHRLAAARRGRGRGRAGQRRSGGHSGGRGTERAEEAPPAEAGRPGCVVGSVMSCS